ncbi:hypothetical protein PLESTF_001292500 [Pleodorina starrii]|nr:hypothetical protein PLESTF_001292500 [Pleodorina starrii]
MAGKVDNAAHKEVGGEQEEQGRGEEAEGEEVEGEEVEGEEKLFGKNFNECESMEVGQHLGGGRIAEMAGKIDEAAHKPVGKEEGGGGERDE